MGRKLLAVLTAFALLLSMCSTALATEWGTVRKTEFFTGQPHAELDFSEMKYKRIDADSVLKEMEELRALLDNAENLEAVEERFNALTSRYMDAMTMYSLAEIKAHQNAADDQAAKELEAARSACLSISDALPGVVQDILSSPCSAFLLEQLSEEEISYYLSYRPASARQIALSNQEATLERKYRQTAAQTFTTEYFGREWDTQSVRQAYAEGSVDAGTYAEICGILAGEQNKTLGSLYLRLVKLRQDIASSYGYANYGDYAYRRLYGRDYAQEDIADFREAVKEYIVPLCVTLDALAEEDGGVFSADYSGDIALDMIEPYIGRMSSELLESFTYMRDHHLYDSEKSAAKDDVGFTAILYSYGAPFFFNAPADDLYDFTTTIHEFGHYNSAYWQELGWNASYKSFDVMEVHSQGLELLLSRYYPEIFGQDADSVTDYQIASLVSAICQGAYYDELQQYVYSTENVTLEQINQEAARLSVEYGFADEEGPAADVYGLSWVQVSHNFTSPFYYISYAVSAAGAFAFWLEAQEDYFSAVDKYLAYTALDASFGFEESFETLGLKSPLEAGYLEQLSQTLWRELNVSKRLERLAEDQGTVFSDVPADSWYAPYVLALAELGCVAGYEDGTFRPDEPASWGAAMGALLSLTGQKPELEDGDSITRLEFCQLITEVLGIPAASGSPSPFTDTEDGAAVALAEYGVISGYENGAFQPDGTLTRAQLCVILCRAAEVVSLLEENSEEEAGNTEDAEKTDELENTGEKAA